MTDTTVTLPLTPARIGRGVESIVEQTFPRPRQELCLPVGEMERKLTAFVGEVVQAAYDDAAGIARDARERLARHLYLTDVGVDQHNIDFWARASTNLRRRYEHRADRILAVITGQES